MKKLWWTLRFHLQEMGLQGGLGLGFIFGALVIATAVLLPDIRDMKRMEQENAQLRMKPAVLRTAQRSPTSAHLVFYKSLPPENQASWEIAKIFEIAEANDIWLQRIEYSRIRNPDIPVSKYQIDLPMQGGYTDIRMFMIDLLNQMPAVAINELSFRREDIDSPDVEAKLRLTIYLGRQA